MRYACGLFLAFCSVLTQAQNPPVGPPLSAKGPIVETAAPQVDLLQSREIQQAAADIVRISELVQAGALPRMRLEEAEAKMADAQDDLILSRMLYGELPSQNLTEQAAEEMVAAAQRRVERQLAKLSRSQALVNDGIIAKADLQPLQDELNMRRMHLNLAHTRSKLISDLASIARYEKSQQALQAAVHIEPYTDFTMGSMVHHQGNDSLLAGKDLQSLELAFKHRFEHPLPISADGQTSVHNTLGFDHRGRIDVAVNPNDQEGVWLRRYLEAKGYSYYAFLRAIPGRATGAHIHIGPGSTRLHSAD